jgi:hypothetical protein
MRKSKRQWEEEHKKCVSSPYYFYINYVKVIGADGELIAPDTRMTEEEFNKAYEGMSQEGLTLSKNRRRR